MFKQISIKTNRQVDLIDITSRIEKELDEFEVNEGILLITVPHTTAAITINENADPSVKEDIAMELNKIVPFNDNYKHVEGNSAAHIKSSIIGSEEMLIVRNGRLNLGRWQGLIFCEFDGPRSRKVNIKVIEG